jgi:hypothetical protein
MTRRGTRARRATLRDALLFSVPLMALAVGLLGAACLDYHRISQFDDWWSRATSVRKFGWYRVRAALNAPSASTLRGRLSAEDTAREVVRLRVDRGVWDELHSDVGGTWGTWVDAVLERDEDLHSVKLRFRGDGSAHWTSEKKSLALKTDKDDLYKGFRRLNFTVKDVLPQYLTNSLAADFDLLGPETAVVPLFVNGHYYGVFRFVEAVDESFLRRNDRMPGNVFRGDTAERGEYFKGLPRELFLNPEIWERVAANDRPGAPQPFAIRGLIEDLNGSTYQDHQRMMSWLDQDELSRLLALMLACGDPFHMSGIHNQLWYEDPVTGLLHPIVWDLRLLDLERPPPHSNYNRLWRAVLRDPRVLDGALETLADWLADDRLAELARARVESTYELYREHFEYDELRSGVIHPVGDPRSTLERFDANLATLRGWTQDARVSVHVEAQPDGSHLIDLFAGGRAGAELVGLAFESGPPHRVDLVADQDRDGARSTGDRPLEVTLDSNVGTYAALLERPEILLPGCGGSGAELVSETLHYRFFLRAEDRDGAPLELASLRPVLRRRHDRAPLEPAAWEPVAVPSTSSWHPWQEAALEREDVHLAGDVHLREDLVIPAGSTLTIAPGTTLALDPDVSVLVRGRLLAHGREGSPITVVNADATRPFGVFALQGSGANGSRIEHTSFEGGGGRLVDRIEYKGSVCVHDADGVLFRDCAFAANMRCDDLVNVVSARVDLVRCTFDDANADAIDYDLSSGAIRDCVIRNSGNDGIDLMSCSPRIVTTSIVGSGDKGISVGENARPLVWKSEISGCERGMEVKDLSTPMIFDTRIVSNVVGVVQRHKNWRYGAGGRAKLIGSILADNELDYEGGGDSVLTESGADLEWARELISGSSRVLLSGAFVDDFGPPTKGWRAMGRVRSLGVRTGALTAKWGDGAGAIGALVDWQLPHDRSRYLLVIEAAGSGLAEARVTVATEGDELSVPLALDANPDIARYTILELTAGTVRALTVAAQPTERRGTLRIFGWRVVVVPREEI